MKNAMSVKAKEGYEEVLANHMKMYEGSYHRTLELLKNPEFLG